MTTANKITIARILLAPFFILGIVYYVDHGNESFRLGALACFGLISLGDAVDGYIARRYHQQSELGAVLDPLADKLLLVSAIILLSMDTHGFFVRLPRWFTMTIIGRDVLVLIGLGLVRYIMGKVSVRPRVTGKIGTALQMATVIWTLLKGPKSALPYLAIGAGLFTGASGFLYAYDGARQLGAHPSSGPAQRQ